MIYDHRNITIFIRQFYNVICCDSLLASTNLSLYIQIYMIYILFNKSKENQTFLKALLPGLVKIKFICPSTNNSVVRFFVR